MIDKVLIRYFEREFSWNQYKGQFHSEIFKHKKGKVPVLLSAPHTVYYKKPDQNDKLPEILTGSLVKLLHSKTDCHIIYRTNTKKEEADSEERYREAIARIIQEYHICLFVEIHGFKDSYGAEIEIGTNNGINISKHANIDRLLVSFLNNAHFSKIITDKKFKASKPETNCRWINEVFGVSSMQIEINQELRNLAKLNGFLNLVKAFENFICYLKPILNSDFIIGKFELTNKISPHNRLDIYTADLENIECGDIYQVDSVHIANDLVIKSVNQSEVRLPVFKVTKRSMVNRKWNVPLGVIVRKNKISSSYLKPPFEKIIGTHECLISDLYAAELNNPSYLFLTSKFSGCSGLFKARIIDNQELKSIYLNYTQRRLLGLELPYVTSSKIHSTLCAKIPGIEDSYEPDRDLYKLKNLPQEEYINVASSYKRAFGVLDIYAFPKIQKFGLENRIFDFLIGNRSVSLRSIHPYGIDESNNVIRISKDNIKVLGLEEGDSIRIEYGGNGVVAKVLSFENLSFLMRENGIFDINDFEFIIGIPASLRGKLGLSNVGMIVQVKRNTKYLLLKNLDIQMFSILGLIITIFSLPNELIHIKGKITAILIFLPLIIWLTFSKERSKIK